MNSYLKIENIGVCPPEGFTVLGVSLADTSQQSGVIGQFGSGNKHGVAVLLRHEIPPIVFSGNLRLKFSSRPQIVDDGLTTKQFGRAVVEYGGVDMAGRHRSGSEDLGFVLDYGRHDWGSVDMALREFISNAIDRTIRETGKWDSVVVEIVSERHVRAKAGHTRLFVPLTDDVLRFYRNLGKWFLHFSEPELLQQTVLPKSNRNLVEGVETAVVYRRGVRVREFGGSARPSLFDYNLPNLRLDESRLASDWDVLHYCGEALSAASADILAVYLRRLADLSQPSVWEAEFTSYALRRSCGPERDTAWRQAILSAGGQTGVLCESVTMAERLRQKGYQPVHVPVAVRDAALGRGLPVDSTVLTVDELCGRDIQAATPEMQAAVSRVWEWLESAGMTDDRARPVVRSFTSLVDEAAKLYGYCRDGVVYINRDVSGTDGGEASQQLLQVALEEVAHYVTGATDNSRDFQSFLRDLAVRLALMARRD